MEQTPAREQEQKQKAQLKKQTILDINGIRFTVNHHYNGTRNIREVYRDFLKRKIEIS